MLRRSGERWWVSEPTLAVGSKRIEGIKMRTAVLLVLSMIHAGAVAENAASTGTVQSIYTYGDGTVLVTGFHFSGASCINNGAFFLAGSHPNLPKVLALLISAKTTGATVTVVAKIDNCWYPQFMTDQTSYLVVH